MPNEVLVIDPYAKTVELAEIVPGRSILDQIRELVGCQLLTTIKPAPRTVLWLDNLGLLKGDSQRFWRMKDSPIRFAGRTVMTAVDPDGMPLPVSIPLDQFRAGIDWCEGARIARVWEELHVEHHPELGPWPRVIPQVEFAGEPPVVEELELFVPPAGGAEFEMKPHGHRYWIVFEEDVDFLCRERTTTDDGQGDWTGEQERFESLDEVRAFAAQRDLHFVLREKDDPEGVAGTIV